jgi:hypothetical protein
VRAKVPGRAAVALALLGLAACGGGGGGGDLVGRGVSSSTTTSALPPSSSTADPTAATGPATSGPGGGSSTATTAFAGPTGGPLDVTAVDYRFELPATIPKDATSIRLVNQGAVDHELLVGRMNDGVTLDQVKAATNLKTLVPQTITLDAKPGQAAETAIEVTAGNWFMACYLTTPDGKSHSELGMIGTFTAP